MALLVPYMSKLLLAFYGDDFTGSTDALEQLALAGVRAALFIEPPTLARLRQIPELQAVGVAGITRSLSPAAMEKELRPAFEKLKALGVRHVHYKVCSTFDSSPAVGSIGRAIDVAMNIFRARFVPLLAAAPALGRYTIFGTHFARFGIGSTGEIHRLDRHPSVSRHPVTPMTEADLRLHLSRQTKKKIALFDILKLAAPENESRLALKEILADKPDVILFDTLCEAQLEHLGRLIDSFATRKHSLFSVGSSGIEMALAAFWKSKGRVSRVSNFKVRESQSSSLRRRPILIASGSCSPVTANQIVWALHRGFTEVPLDVAALASGKKSGMDIQRATGAAVKLLRNGRSVIVHTTPRGFNERAVAKLRGQSARILGTALGKILRSALAQSRGHRLCIAGGDTSSYVARVLGIEALEMIAPLTPGAPLCKAIAPGSPADGCEIVFKGGQVGGENYFGIVKRGKV